MSKEKISDLCMIFFITVVILFYPRRGSATNDRDSTMNPAPPVQVPEEGIPKFRNSLIRENLRLFIIAGNAK